MLFLSRFFQRFGARPSGQTPAGHVSPPFRLRAVLTTLALLGAAFGCSASAENGPGGGEEPEPPEPPEVETIEFVPSDTLFLAPSEVSSLTVLVAPRRRQNVTFELLTETAGFDGFLFGSEARVRDDGTATVELRAPSIPALFTVRASLPEGARTVLSVTVSGEGYGSIEVTPRYEGARTIPQWTASAHINKTCESLDSFWNDGDLTATGASRATIENVPSGVPVAVAIRGGQLASGCATLTALRADDAEQVEIDVSDRPIDVMAGTLTLRLGISSSTGVFADHLSEAIASGRGYFRGEHETDAAALLSLMSEGLTPSELAEFNESRETYGLDALVHGAYQEDGPITEAIGRMLGDAAATLSGPSMFRGQISLAGAASQFLLQEVAGIEASKSGFFQGSTWMVSSESGDMLVLGGTLTYEPLRWLGAIARSQAEASQAGAEPSARILEEANCPLVGQTIFEAVSSPVFSACDESCLVERCEDKLAPLWESLLAQGPPLTTLQLGISGRAALYGAARVESMQGSWVGRLGSEDETSVGGTAEAELFFEE